MLVVTVVTLCGNMYDIWNCVWIDIYAKWRVISLRSIYSPLNITFNLCIKQPDTEEKWIVLKKQINAKILQSMQRENYIYLLIRVQSSSLLRRKNVHLYCVWGGKTGQISELLLAVFKLQSMYGSDLKIYVLTHLRLHTRYDQKILGPVFLK